MKLYICPTDINSIKNYIKTDSIQAIVVGLKDFSSQNNCILTIDEIKELKKTTDDNKKELILQLDNFVFEKEIKDLTKALLDIERIGVCAIMFSDFAINQIHYENNMKTKLIYDGKTLVTNYFQFPFYLKNNIKEVVLANELSGKQVLDICLNKKDMKVIKQSSGYANMMRSRWKLLTHFKEKNNISDSLINKKVFIQEETRDFPSILYENKHGTQMLTSYNLTCIDLLTNFDVDYLIINGFLHNNNWLEKTIMLYNKTIKIIDSKENHNFSTLFTEEVEINKEEQLSYGFLSNKVENNE